jgi:hypothetical protein
MHSNPGKPKPPGNPPTQPEPDKPKPVEEPPEPVPVPPERDEPTPMEAYPVSLRVGNVKARRQELQRTTPKVGETIN